MKYVLGPLNLWIDIRVESTLLMEWFNSPRLSPGTFNLAKHPVRTIINQPGIAI